MLFYSEALCKNCLFDCSVREKPWTERIASATCQQRTRVSHTGMWHWQRTLYEICKYEIAVLRNYINVLVLVMRKLFKLVDVTNRVELAVVNLSGAMVNLSGGMARW